MWSKMIGELYMGMNEVEGSNGDHLYFYARVLRKESTGILFITNTVFFFVGNATVIMPYSLTKLLWVVLAIVAHSHERMPMVGTRMILARRNGQCFTLDNPRKILIHFVQGTGIDVLVFTYQRSTICLKHHTTLVVDLNDS